MSNNLASLGICAKISKRCLDLKFADRLRASREEADISRKELALKTGISYEALSKYETGEREPDFETLCKIAKFFEVSTDFLLGNSNIKAPDDILKGLPAEARQTAEWFIKFLHERHKTSNK